MAKTIWSGVKGSTNGFLLTTGNIKNAEHYYGHKIVQYSSYNATTPKTSDLIDFTPIGTKTGDIYTYGITSGTDELQLVSLINYIDFNENAAEKSSISSYFGVETYFIGASGNQTHTHVERAKTELVIQKTNSITDLQVADILWTESDTSTDTDAVVSWDSYAYAFDKSVTAVVSNTNAVDITSGKQVTGQIHITPKTSFSTTVFGTDGTAKFTTTITAADHNLTVNPEYQRTLTSSEITLRNTVNHVEFNTTDIYLNTGKGETDKGGSAKISAVANNTKNNQNTYLPVSVWTADEDIARHISTVNGDHNSGAEVTVTALTGTAAPSTAMAYDISAVSKDGKLDSAKDSIKVHLAIPSISPINVNVGETVDKIALSSMAGETYCTSMTSLDTSKATTSASETTHQFKVTGVAPTDSEGIGIKWETSDGAELYVGKIIVAAGIVVYIYKGAEGTDIASDANFGDTLRVVVVGGTTDTTFTLSTTLEGASFSKSTSVKANENITLTLPDGSSSNNGTYTITATPNKGTGASTTLDVQHLTFTLS